MRRKPKAQAASAHATAIAEPCPNCQATYHVRCCARCGREIERSATYCTAACEAAQQDEDVISAAQEAANQEAT